MTAGEGGLTYPEVGATAGPLPAGYRHMTGSRVIGHGAAAFAAAAEALLSWQLQRRSGLRVSPADAIVEPGSEVVLQAGLGPFGVRAPARVVYTVDDACRRGFAYGTLPGHPVAGEESFVVERRPDDSVVLSIRAFSRPVGPAARLAGPLTGMLQRLALRRYLRALDGAAGRRPLS